jgi:putative flippase GtrA
LTETRTQIQRQIFRFLQVGLVGFTIDVSVISLLLYGVGLEATDVGLIGSRVVSFLAAISATFFLNASYTFGSSLRQASFSVYVAIQCLGAAINLGTYTALVLFGPFNQDPLVALVIGSASATLSNFLLARRFVYHRGEPGLEN